MLYTLKLFFALLATIFVSGYRSASEKTEDGLNVLHHLLSVAMAGTVIARFAEPWRSRLIFPLRDCFVATLLAITGFHRRMSCYSPLVPNLHTQTFAVALRLYARQSLCGSFVDALCS